jgi:hypothetical protein
LPDLTDDVGSLLEKPPTLFPQELPIIPTNKRLALAEVLLSLNYEFYPTKVSGVLSGIKSHECCNQNN